MIELDDPSSMIRRSMNELERISALFINSDYLTDDARNATMKGMPGLGEIGAPGSVSFVVSQGKARSTEHTVLFIAADAVAGAAMISVLLLAMAVARSVLVRRKRSSPTSATVELKPGTVKLDKAAAPEIVIASALAIA